MATMVDCDSVPMATCFFFSSIQGIRKKLLDAYEQLADEKVNSYGDAAGASQYIKKTCRSSLLYVLMGIQALYVFCVGFTPKINK